MADEVLSPGEHEALVCSSPSLNVLHQRQCRFLLESFSVLVYLPQAILLIAAVLHYLHLNPRYHCCSALGSLRAQVVQARWAPSYLGLVARLQWVLLLLRQIFHPGWEQSDRS